MKVLGIVGSSRKQGVTDALVSAALEGAAAAGAETEKIYLIDQKLEFCGNCRACTQEPGPRRGRCVKADGLEALLERCDAADAFVLGAPVNFFNVNAVTRQFMERLVGYAYWPWGQLAPRMRDTRRNRYALLVTGSAMPAFLGRLLTGAVRALKALAEALGARVCGVIFAGGTAMRQRPEASRRLLAKAFSEGGRLADKARRS